MPAGWLAGWLEMDMENAGVIHVGIVPNSLLLELLRSLSDGYMSVVC